MSTDDLSHIDSDIGLTGVSSTSGLDNTDFIIKVSKNSSNEFHISVTGGGFEGLGRKVDSTESSLSVFKVDGTTERFTVEFNYSGLKEGQAIVRLKSGTLK
ncbi:hypothetical protein D3C74_150690 [compost metagenome]